MRNFFIGIANLGFGALLSFFDFFLLGGYAYSEDLSNPLSRYTREFIEDESLAHWNTPVFFQIAGRDVDETSFHAASLVSYFGRNSGVEMQFLGDSPSWFLPKTRIEPNANFVFIFEDLDRSLGGNRETITLADLGLDIQSKSSPLANLVSKCHVP